MPRFKRFGTARAAAILPAAGAYDLSPTAIATENFNEASFMISYTRGGANGAITYKVELSEDGTDWFQTADVRPGAYTAGNDLVDPTQRVEFLYTATGNANEKVMSPTFIVAAKFFRVVAKESGNVGAPGTATIYYSLFGSY